MIDPDSRFANYLKLRVFAGVVISFLVSAWYCFDSCRYALWGKTTVAKIQRIDPAQVDTFGRSNRVIRQVHYTFDDPEIVGKEVLNRQGDIVKSGPTRYEFADIDNDWEPPVVVIAHAPSLGSQPNQLDIEYIPGSTMNSRLAGTSNAVRCMPFILTSITLIGFVASFMTDYYKHERSKQS